MPLKKTPIITIKALEEERWMQWRSAYSKVVGSELTSLDLETLPVRQRYQGREGGRNGGEHILMLRM